MLIREKNSKSILSLSKIYNYVINPYTGCQFGCSYCYALYMKKFSGHKEPRGDFVDVKINAAALLKNDILKQKKGQVWISGVCDPYQPLEAKYKLTRGCLEVLAAENWPVIIQTKSKLVLRDIEIIKKIRKSDVGFSIGTSDDNIRKIFEPEATPIFERINALKKLHDCGISTYAMIAPILPGAERLIDMLIGKIDYLYADRMNYGYAAGIYKKNNLEQFLTDGYFSSIEKYIIDKCIKSGIKYKI